MHWRVTKVTRCLTSKTSKSSAPNHKQNRNDWGHRVSKKMCQKGNAQANNWLGGGRAFLSKPNATANGKQLPKESALTRKQNSSSLRRAFQWLGVNAASGEGPGVRQTTTGGGRVAATWAILCRASSSVGSNWTAGQPWGVTASMWREARLLRFEAADRRISSYCAGDAAVGCAWFVKAVEKSHNNVRRMRRKIFSV